VRGALAVSLALLANTLIVVGVNALGITPAFQALTVPPVAVLSALGAGGATVVYWLLSHLVTNVDRTFLRVTAVVLVFSFIPDVALLAFDPAATPLIVLLLMAMHVVVAAVAVWTLLYWGADR
jgi:hypothetical protein